MAEYIPVKKNNDGGVVLAHGTLDNDVISLSDPLSRPSGEKPVHSPSTAKVFPSGGEIRPEGEVFLNKPLVEEINGLPTSYSTQFRDEGIQRYPLQTRAAAIESVDIVSGKVTYKSGSFQEYSYFSGSGVPVSDTAFAAMEDPYNVPAKLSKLRGVDVETYDFPITEG